MAKQTNLDIRMLDRRVVERYIRRGALTDKDYQQYVKDLDDQDGNCDTMPIPEGATARTDADADA